MKKSYGLAIMIPSFFLLVFLQASVNSHCQQTSKNGSFPGVTDRPKLAVQFGHSWSISSVLFSRNEEYILTAGSTAVLWDTRTGREVRRFDGQNGVFSPTGEYVLTSYENKATLWNTKTGSVVRNFEIPIVKREKGLFDIFPKPDPNIRALAFAPDEHSVLLGAEDGEIYQLDVRTGRKIRQFTGSSGSISALAVSPDGNYFLTATKGTGLLSSSDSTARLWDIRTGKEVQSFIGHTNNINSATFSPDGKKILTGSGGTGFLWGSSDSTARLWDVATGKEIHRFTAPKRGPTGYLDLSSQIILCVAYSPDGKYVLAGVDDNTVRLWEAETGREVKVLSQFGYVDKIAFSNDGKRFLTAEFTGLARITDLSTGKDVQRFEGRSATTNYAAFSSDGRYVVTAAIWGRYSPYNLVRLWDLQKGKQVRQFPIKTLISLSLSPDDKYLFAQDDDNLTIWDFKSGTELKKFKSQTAFSIAMSPNGKYILLAGIGNTAQLLESESGNEVRQFAHRLQYAEFINLSPGGRYVITSSSDAWVRLTDVETGQRTKLDVYSDSAQFSADGKYVITKAKSGTLSIWETQTGKEIQKLSGNFNVAALSPDRRYVFTGEYNQPVKLWDVATGKPQGQLDINKVSTMVYSPDGGRLLTVYGEYDDDKVVAQLWDAKTLSEVLRFDVPKRKATYMIYMVFSPDGKYFVSSGDDTKAKLWNAETGKMVREFPAWPDSLAFSPDGRYIVASEGLSEDVQVLDVASGKELGRIKVHLVKSVEFSPDGSKIITATFDKKLQTWDSKKLTEISHTQIDENERGRDSYNHMASVAFSPDGRFVVTGSSNNKATIWNAETGEEIHQFSAPGNVNSVAYSPNGKYLLVAGKDSVLWEADSKKQIKVFEKTGSGGAAISADSKYILTGDSRGGVQLWDIATGQQIRSFKGHSESISSVAFSADGKYVLTSSSDGTARLWRANTGDELCRLIDYRDGQSAVVDLEGSFDLSDIERAGGMSWVMPDDPLNPLPLDIYIRDYYQPRLLTRALNGETFPYMKRLVDRNRAQPIVEIKQVKQHVDDPTQLSVTVEATEGEYKTKQISQGPTRKSGIYDLRLFRDGKLIDYDPKSSANIQAYSQLGKQASFDDELKVWRSITQFKPDPQTGNRKTFTISLPKNRDMTEVELSAYAFNDDRVKSETYRETYKLLQPLKASAKGTAYLITIGVAASQDPHWNLLYPANDARRMQKDLYDRLSKQYDQVVRVPLISDYGGITKRFGDCIEKKPSREAIRTVMDLLAGRDVGARKELVPCADEIQKANPEDLVLISFSGHGYGDGVGNYYLFPYDTGKLNEDQQIGDKLPDELLNRLISSEELSAWMRDIDAGEFVMVLDACQSEAVTGAEFKPGPMGSRGLGQLAYDKGMRMIVATQADNQAVGAGALSHGLLTYALTKEGLEYDNAQNLSVKEWLERAAERVPRLYEEKVPEEVKKQSKLQQPAVFDFARAKELLLFGKSN